MNPFYKTLDPPITRSHSLYLGQFCFKKEPADKDLCPDTVCSKLAYEGGGGQKLVKSCLRSLWMAPTHVSPRLSLVLGKKYEIFILCHFKILKYFNFAQRAC